MSFVVALNLEDSPSTKKMGLKEKYKHTTVSSNGWGNSPRVSEWSAIWLAIALIPECTNASCTGKIHHKISLLLITTMAMEFIVLILGTEAM